jgi:cobyrinic acid a,c-diamide synthase
MPFTQPRVIIGALKGGSGKTILSLGLIAAWRDQGHQIAPFKKGPDFIDAGWLTFAAARSCHNLDSFMMSEEQILRSFFTYSHHADLTLVEGNRGLFDGMDLDGSSSTAELAKLLKAPVILVVDVTMATRTIAAIVKGCQAFDPGVNIVGVVLNRVAGARQETLITRTIERYCGLGVVGAVPRLRQNPFPERHMGLVPHQESDHAKKAVLWAKAIAQKNLQLEEIWRVAQEVDLLEPSYQHQPEQHAIIGADPPQIGFIRDKAFWFYYPENLEQLERMGANLVEINAVSQTELPQLDALYVGGGFPEVQAQALAENQVFRAALKLEIEKGLPVYAECGGFMYMGKRLLVDGRTYPMVGALPVDFVLEKSPQGHGYTILEVNRSNPYYPVGQILKGHEFHYSRAFVTNERTARFLFKVSRGQGVDGRRDGMFKKNLLATYTHVHAAGNLGWAKNLLRVAVAHKTLSARVVLQGGQDQFSGKVGS